jgi:hypothetical protein
MEKILTSKVDLNTLSNNQLSSLVRAAADVLAGHADEILGNSVMTISTKAAAQELAPMLQRDDELVTAKALQGVLEDPLKAKQISIVVLDQLRKSPELALAVDEAYARDAKKMSIETILLVGAVVVLAIKIKDFEYGHVRIKFFECSEVVKAFLTSLVSKVP